MKPPAETPLKRICALTTVRNDTIFLKKWIAYYGAQFGRKNLFVILDGHDQPLPTDSDGVNFIRLPHIPLERAAADRRRARVMSDIARGLFRHFDIAIALDVDEFIVLDPAIEGDLAQYLSSHKSRSSISALGLDVAQHVEQETAIDLARPFLAQRHFALVSDRYTKPNIAMRPLTWGSGMHRIKGRNFHIDPNLFLFHFGMVDYTLSTGKTQDRDRIDSGWSNHLSRREAVFGIVAKAEPMEGDAYFPTARRNMTWRRAIYALNKPAPLAGKPVVRIPERFRDIL